MKFKPGDKVRYVKNLLPVGTEDDSGAEIGMVGEVTFFEDEYSEVIVMIPGLGEIEFVEEELELVE